MTAPSRRNTRTFYLEDAVDAVVAVKANRDHGGNRSAYIQALVMRDLKTTLMAEAIAEAHQGGRSVRR